MKKWQTFLQISILVAAMKFVIWPLVTPGFIPTHDGEYHLIRIWQFDKMLSAGIPFPRWAPDLNSRYGLPLFNFQYPFPDYIGSMWHRLGSTLADSVKLTLMTGYVAAIIFCYLWLLTIYSPFSAVVGTIFFMFVPYWFVDIYVRGSVGEVLGISWVMMSLYAIEKKNAPLLTIGIGLLILTHNIMAMIFFPLLCIYVLCRRREFWRWMALGTGLASYFWIPALLESKYMTGLNTVSFRDYFPRLDQLLIPSWGTGFSGGLISGNEMSVQIGVVPIILFMISAGIVIYDALKRRLTVSHILWLLLVVMIIFLMLPVSLPLWRLIPLMPLIQYPWRLLSVLMVATGFIGAYVSSRVPKPIAVIVAIFAIVMTYGYIRPVTYLPRSDAYYLSRRNFTDGTSSLGNALSTIWTGWKDKRAAAPLDVVAGKATVRNVNESVMGVSAVIDAQSRSAIRLNKLYFPGWSVLSDGNAVVVTHNDGLINFSLTPGMHRIRAYFGETSVRVFADAISLISVFILGALFLKRG